MPDDDRPGAAAFVLVIPGDVFADSGSILSLLSSSFIFLTLGSSKGSIVSFLLGEPQYLFCYVLLE